MANFDWVPTEYQGRFSYVGGKLVASCEICGATRATSGKGSVLRDIVNGRGDKFRLCGIHGNYKNSKPSPEDIASWPAGHKRCRACKEVKPLEDFHAHRQALFGVGVECKGCRKPKSKSNYATRSREQLLWERAKRRARVKGREFTIKIEDISIPDFCPVLGIPLYVVEGETDNSPSLDRIDSSKGYTSDNIQVMSTKANKWKNNMTVEEVVRLYQYMIKETDVVDLIKA